MSDRTPYVGTGADGCRRSAQIDREEADGLAPDDERWASLMVSADAWEHQARLLDEAGMPSPKQVGPIQNALGGGYIVWRDDAWHPITMTAMSDGTVRWQ